MSDQRRSKESARPFLGNDQVAGLGSEFLPDLVRVTYDPVHLAFGRCYVFMGKSANNAILLSPGPELPDLTPEIAVEQAALLQERHLFTFSMKAIARQFRPRFRPSPWSRILTDERLGVSI